MKRVFRKISAAVTAAAIMFTSIFVFGVPELKVLAATAAGNFSTLKTAVESGGTVTITSDITFTDCITVNKTVTIQSQGNYTLKRGSSYTGEMFNVITGGNLTLDGSGNNLTVDGGITWSGTKDSILGRGKTYSGPVASDPMIDINGSGTVTLKTGVTLQNAYSSASTGSAVGMEDSAACGTLNINGAVIRNNYASNGGAIKTHYNATVNMTSGEIYGNESGRHGGAMQIYGQAPLSESTKGEAHFNMSGGKIHNNLSAGVGGAIAVSNCGHLTLSGTAEIYGNKTTDSSKRGGGVGFIDRDTTLNISGSAKIYDNIDSTGKANNLTIGTNSNNKITLGALSSGAKIGITYNQSSANTSSSFANTNSTDYSSCFFSDRDGYFVEYKNQGLYLKEGCTTAHSWDSGTVTTAATCTTSGVKTYTCTACGAKKTEDIAAAGHSYGTSWVSDAAQHWHECANCGAADTKANHTWDSGKVTTAATCGKDGIKTYTCTVCGKTKTENITQRPNHIFSYEYNSTQHRRVCGLCGYTSTGWTDHSGGTATCQTQATCSVCGQKYGSLGAHSYGTNWVTSDTQHWHKCTVSGCTSVQDTADHTFVQKSDGTNHWQECSVCGYKKDETAHSWGNWTLTAEPTLTAAGAAERACSCGEKQAVTVPELTDTTVWAKDDTQHVDATEDGDGKDVYTSTDYGNVTVVLPALEHIHVWGDWTITANPTLTATGTAQRVCTKNDTHTDTKTLPVLTDTSVWTKTQHVDPTEKAEGKDVYTSEYGNVTVPIEKLPHTHVLTHVDEVPPTAEKEGVKEHWHCDGCGKDFLDEDGNREATAEDLRIGKTETEVQAPANVPKPTISTPKEEIISMVLTQEEQEKVKEGLDIKIILKVEDASQNAPAEDKAKIETVVEGLEDYKLGQYLDVTLLKKIGEQAQEAVTSTSKPITVTFEIPENLRGMAKYSVIRVHGGETTVLEDEDSDPDTVTIKTDKFSTYALTYQAKAAATEPNGGNGASTPIITPIQNGNSDATSSESDTSNAAVSTSNESAQAPSGENSASGEDNTDNHDGNPSTGVAISLVPSATALVFVAAARRKKK